MARVYREAPLNSVWECTANMMCMDLRRAMTRDPRTIEALFNELKPLAGQDARLGAMVQHTKRLVREAVDNEFLARPMTESVARVPQAAEVIRHSPQEVADAFLSTRFPALSGSWGAHFGTLAVTVSPADAQKIMRRAMVTD